MALVYDSFMEVVAKTSTAVNADFERLTKLYDVFKTQRPTHSDGKWMAFTHIFDAESFMDVYQTDREATWEKRPNLGHFSEELRNKWCMLEKCCPSDLVLGSDVPVWLAKLVNSMTLGHLMFRCANYAIGRYPLPTLDAGMLKFTMAGRSYKHAVSNGASSKKSLGNRHNTTKMGDLAASAV